MKTSRDMLKSKTLLKLCIFKFNFFLAVNTHCDKYQMKYMSTILEILY